MNSMDVDDADDEDTPNDFHQVANSKNNLDTLCSKPSKINKNTQLAKIFGNDVFFQKIDTLSRKYEDYSPNMRKKRVKL